VFRAYQDVTQKKAWCHENFLHYRNLEYGSEVRQQLAALAERANLEKASCGTNTKQLRKAFLEGLYENLAELQRDQTYVTVSRYTILLIPVLLYYSSFYSHSSHRILCKLFLQCNLCKRHKVHLIIDQSAIELEIKQVCSCSFVCYLFHHLLKIKTS